MIRGDTGLPDPSRFASRVLDWVQSMKVADGEYRYSGTKPAFALSSYFALCTRLALGRPIDEPDRVALIGRLQSLQDPETGMFRTDDHDEALLQLDKPLKITPAARCYQPLALLGARPLYPMRFLDRLATPDGLTSLLESQDWVRAWMASCDSFTAYDLVKREGRATAEWLDAYFAWHDGHQDPKTGYWGPAQGSEIWQGFGATFHILIPYAIERRPINHAERIVKTTLSLQSNPDPLGQKGTHPNIRSSEFRSTAGYLNHWHRNHNVLDAVDMLVNLRPLVSSLLQQRIDLALEEAVAGTVRTQNADGGLGQFEGEESDQDATAFGVWAMVMAGFLEGRFYSETCSLIPPERYRGVRD